MTKEIIRKTVLTALFTSLIAASSFFTIPVGPVPVVLTTMFVVLSGMLGGPQIGLSSVVTYLIMGIIGLPVFAGGTAGLAKIMGPTGGFLLGYLLAAPAAGWMYNSKKDRSKPLEIPLAVITSLLAGALIYLPGIPWLKQSLSMDWPTVLKAGLYPFIPGFVIKSMAAAALGCSMKNRFRDFLSTGKED
ncbi:biotin transporter BioY [Oceanispirochaeta crateris]|uniref:Biotin transporter n=1 Tax=Oceanispirochaeta crateris TaxID=2518645 RepID=A0A5C1QNU7_9SPIO|nr:biotin transporter BioY [Oceanispirochaeta crateris]QEN09775.1 biotin transporter BioY [Oceanispirochaeta crateris]